MENALLAFLNAIQLEKKAGAIRHPLTAPPLKFVISIFGER